METGTRPAARRATAQAGNRDIAPRAQRGISGAHEQMIAVKRHLETISAALNGVDPAALSDSEHAQWADALDKVDLAIARVRNALLQGLIAEFEAELPNIRASTARLEADLEHLKNAVAIINTVTAALGIVEQIIRLGR
jgi:hypothetical protein